MNRLVFKPIRFLLLGLACASALVFLSRAENPLPQKERLRTSPVLRHLKPNPVTPTSKNPVEQTLAEMYLPEGFKAELVVGEPDLHQPVAFTFDERGRIWVAEAYSYPQKRPEGQGLDKIVIFEDRNGDGKFETRKEFATGLNLVSGFEVGHGGVWIGAAPQLLFIPDRNHDDLPDGPPEVLLDGFGFQDTHECLNSFMWGPDGWLYGNQGVFNYARIGKPGTPENERTELRAGVWRYHPRRHKFEVFAEGGSNQWGLDYDEHGQIFMTHCRSYWGRGGTTHVIQGGHYWNQANANYASFIIAEPPKDFPDFKNYLLASARYDHGAGGAGVPGSDAIYGGHSHVGTMIYLGDNWPDEYRGHLFTHNLHGHQINQQVNRPWGSGFDTVHAGRDMFFCADPKYVAVDLQYGPDGAVYMIDWYDQQHCHNPNTERWDRSNGRIYRLEYAATYKPVKVDLGKLPDTELVTMLQKKNEWYGRMATRLLNERATAKALEARPVMTLRNAFNTSLDPKIRLKALWSLNLCDRFTAEIAEQALNDPDEFVRGWAIQLSTEQNDISATTLSKFVKMAAADPSQVVRRYLASAVQRVPDASAWQLIEALAKHGEDKEDRNIPKLLWDGMAQKMPKSLDRALAVAENTLMLQLTDWTYWYAATLPGNGLAQAISHSSSVSGEDQRRALAGIELALTSRGNLTAPEQWNQIAPKLYSSGDPRIVRQAESIAAFFGDDSMFPKLRKALAEQSADPELRKHAFAVLSRAKDRGSLPEFYALLDDKDFRPQTLNLLARFDAPEIPNELLKRFSSFNTDAKNAALNTLASRVPLAIALLDAIASGKISRDQLSAFHVRQLADLKNPEVDKRLAATWGRIGASTGEKQEQISRLEKVFNEAPLWAYEARSGREHFQKLCAQCHRVGNDGVRLGPELTGAGRNGIRYFLENIIDPNAVIGTDFQMTVLETEEGDVVSGVIGNESAANLTMRTPTGEVSVPKSKIKQRTTSEKSLMPEGLLEGLNPREQIELLKFLTQS